MTLKVVVVPQYQEMTCAEVDAQATVSRFDPVIFDVVEFCWVCRVNWQLPEGVLAKRTGPVSVPPLTHAEPGALPLLAVTVEEVNAVTVELMLYADGVAPVTVNVSPKMNWLVGTELSV